MFSCDHALNAKLFEFDDLIGLSFSHGIFKTRSPFAKNSSVLPRKMSLKTTKYTLFMYKLPTRQPEVLNDKKK